MTFNKFLKEALLFKKTDKDLQCLTCNHKCKLKPGQTGYCETRKNLDGTLYTLIYGNISSLSNNPIEKKPFYHFYPGSRALTVGSYSCNFSCDWCQNFRISKVKPINDPQNFISPQDLVQLAIKKSNGLSYSFNEPTLLLEHSLEAFKIAKKHHLYNTFVTNGYMTSEAIKLLIKAGLDAMNIDIKGNDSVVKKYCNANLEMIIENAKKAKESGVHIEFTTLVIPQINDSEDIMNEIALIIRENFGEDTPWHLSRYFPHYQYSEPPTEIKKLKKSMTMGYEIGLNYIYIGNVPGHRAQNTYCPACGTLVIKRNIFDVVKNKLIQDKCPNCGKTIPIVL
ncbi:MAG: AmmeMemoRadiSam system radical SAM enzyme [Candidatus Lokiarchaeota archaeon]|nr:AmmeMemoRadiSam system radical SAM enzyme [Candidatus Lokiarchaeota archaeon]